MARIEVRQASVRDMIYVAKRLRDADRMEIAAATLMDPKHIMMATYWHSPIHLCGTVDDEPVVVFGVATTSLLSDVGQPWMLATDKIEEHQMAFLRRCRHYVEDWRGQFSCLENVVDARNLKAILWLDWLGFTLEEAQPFGALGRPFHRFSAGGLYVYDGNSRSRWSDRDRSLGIRPDAGGAGPGIGGSIHGGGPGA